MSTAKQHMRAGLGRKRSWCALPLSALLLLGTASACEDEVQETPPPTETTTAAPPRPTAPPVDTVDEPEYQRPEFPGTTRRNPFKPDPEVLKPAAGIVQGEVRPLEPLERFALGQLELAAIISEVAIPKAMFIDPDGFGHVVKEGDRIGRNSGYISDIRDNEVEITEGSAEEDDTKTQLRTVKLRDAGLTVASNADLTEEERAALEKLLQTPEGRQALQRQYQNAAPATAVEGQAPPVPGNDPRFRGAAPPSAPPQVP